MRTLRHLFCLFLLLPVLASSALAAGLSHAAISCATSSTSVTTASASRVYLLLENWSNTDICVNVNGAAAVDGEGICLKADGGAVWWDVRATMPLAAVNCIHGGTGTKTLLKTEID